MIRIKRVGNARTVDTRTVVAHIRDRWRQEMRDGIKYVVNEIVVRYRRWWYRNVIAPDDLGQ